MQRARTEEELLDREQELALAGLVETAEQMVDDILRGTHASGALAKHPVVMTALAAVGGVAAGKALLAAGKAALRAHLASPRRLADGARWLGWL